MTARDTRKISDIFGSLVRNESGGGASCLVGPDTSESVLRRGLASVAHAYGWVVYEEEVVPWGRIDLVICDADGYRVIELKLDLTKPARIRKAFQQVDGYGRWWVRKQNGPVSCYIAGLSVDAELVGGLAEAYPEIGWSDCADLITNLRTWGSEVARADRRARSQARAAAIQTVLDAYRAAGDATTSTAVAFFPSAGAV